MSIALQAVVFRHERRIRLTFTNELAVGAFGVPAPSYYAVVDEATETTIRPAAALIVPNSPNVVELALESDLASGRHYTVLAIGVPATDATTTPAGSMERFQFGKPKTKETLEPATRDRERLLYGVDIEWDGRDFQEAANGDLQRLEGRECVTKCLWRSVEISGLPWDRTWGVNAREYVDSPIAASLSLRGAIAAQILRDPRVRSVETELEIGDRSTTLHITPTLITGEKTAPVSTTIPNDGT